MKKSIKSLKSLKKVKAISEKQLSKIFGGEINPNVGDQMDVTSELSSNGYTTETGGPR